MSTIKVMSIIGMIFFPFSLICIIGFEEPDIEAALGWGVIASVFGLAYAVTVYVNIQKVPRSSIHNS